MYEVVVEARFSGSHQLRLPGGGSEPLHGHNWKVETRFEGPELNECGVLVDFVEVEMALRHVTDELHHRHLNEMEAFKEQNPSAENVACFVFRRLEAAGSFGKSLVSVRVWEAPGCAGGYFRTQSVVSACVQEA